MNYKSISNILGKLMIVTGCSLFFPIICSLYYSEDDLSSLIITAIPTIAFGFLLWWFFRKFQELNIKDGFFIAFFVKVPHKTITGNARRNRKLPVIQQVGSKSNNIKSDFTCRNVSMFLLGSPLLSLLYCLYFSTLVVFFQQNLYTIQPYLIFK